MLEGMVIGVDLDGVTVNFVSALKPSASAILGCDPALLTDNADWSFKKWGVHSQQQFEAIYVAAVTEGLWRNAEPITGAVNGIRQLSALGASIRFVTARPNPLNDSFSEQSVTETAGWLRKHNVPHDRIIHIGDKAKSGCDVYIDDAPHHIRSLQDANKTVIVFDQPWNSDVEANNLRAYGWGETVGMILALGCSQQLQLARAQ